MRAPELNERKLGSVTFLMAEDLRKWGVTVAFTTRRGGISDGPYSSLNLAFHVGDSSERVSANRALACKALGLKPDRLTCAEQVHGSVVVEVDEVCAGRGAFGRGAIPAADGLITSVEGVPLAVFTADCVPIVLVDLANLSVGAVHAGWRGTIAGIAEVAVERLVRAGADPDNLLAYIGPSIGPCCYEVSEELAASFKREFGKPASPGRRSVDLGAANRIALERAGLRPEAVFDAGICTGCRSDVFFSYRAQGRIAGRQAAIAVINRRSGVR